MSARIVVYRCPEHPASWTLVTEDYTGGVRVAGSKCCARMYAGEQTSWPLTQKLRDDLVEEMDGLLAVPR